MSDKKEWQFIDPIYYEGEAGYLATDSKNTKAFVDKLAKAYEAEKQRADRLEKEWEVKTKKLIDGVKSDIWIKDKHYNKLKEENQKLKEALGQIKTAVEVNVHCSSRVRPLNTFGIIVEIAREALK